MKRIPKKSVGCYARVQYTDVGVRDGIIFRVSDDGKDCRWVQLCEPDSEQTIRLNQIVKIGHEVTAVNSGLN